jgi:hypothetical protein
MEQIQESAAATIEAKGTIAQLDQEDAAAAVAARATQRAAVLAAIQTACGPLMDVANIPLVTGPAMTAFDAN